MIELVLELFAQVNVFRNRVVVGKRAADAQAQIIDLKGLFKVIEGPFLHRLHRRVNRRVGRHHDHRGRRVEGARLLQNLHSVGAGLVKIKIGDDQFRTLELQAFHGGVIAGERKDLVPLRAKHLGDHLHHRYLIINEQDFRHARTLIRARPQREFKVERGAEIEPIEDARPRELGCQGVAGRRNIKRTPMRILVVEDEPDLLRGLSQALREEGYAVDTAANGEDGLFNAQNTDYDAIVLDVMLPKMDGWEVLSRLRLSKKTPVLMLTARDQSKDRVKGLDGGADDYVVKPFDLPELFARLRALIRRGAGQARNVIEIGEVSIDRALRQVRRAGKEVVLTAREYGVVEFLALHAGEVITRTQLYEHLFDENDDTFSNLLDVHVSNIRKKLGHDFIATRRGHGYCVER